MLRSRPVQMLVIAVAVILALCLPAPVLAQEPAPCTPPDASLVFPAGIACSAFDLKVDICNNPNRVFRTFTDQNGNPVRVLEAGKGSALTFTNQSNGNMLTTRANGAVMRTTPNGDGTYTVKVTGHNLIILWPSDQPAGPSTTLYVGQVTYLRDDAYNFTLLSSSGTQTDICAALQ